MMKVNILIGHPSLISPLGGLLVFGVQKLRETFGQKQTDPVQDESSKAETSMHGDGTDKFESLQKQIEQVSQEMQTLPWQISDILANGSFPFNLN